MSAWKLSALIGLQALFPKVVAALFDLNDDMLFIEGLCADTTHRRFSSILQERSERAWD
jgi:hypothetical protein